MKTKALSVPDCPSCVIIDTCATGSYLRLIDSCITQLKVEGPSRTCNESKEEEGEDSVHDCPSCVVIDTCAPPQS